MEPLLRRQCGFWGGDPFQKPEAVKSCLHERLVAAAQKLSVPLQRLESGVVPESEPAPEPERKRRLEEEIQEEVAEQNPFCSRGFAKFAWVICSEEGRKVHLFYMLRLQYMSKLGTKVMSFNFFDFL